MFKKSFKYIVVLFLIAVAGVLGSMLWLWKSDFDATKVVFLDVGQGDAILISQGSNQMLIDGGRSGKVLLERLGEYMPFWDSQIETVVATHPDEDHIGGLVDAVDTYRVGVFLDTKMKSETAVYKALQEAKLSRNVEDREVFSGLSVTFPDGGKIETLYPHESFTDSRSKDTNATSIVMKLTAASGKTFLFTGDLPSEQEPMIDTAGHIDVLKAGHHGSKYSSLNEFLERLKPKDTILSVGLKNRYGHPSPETLDRLENIHARIFRTDTQGTISYLCPPAEGNECTVTTAKDGYQVN